MSDIIREPFKPGDRFLKYEIGKLLGKGGHAFVYEANHLFLRRTDAIKIIRSPRESGRDLAQRAEAEAQVLARLEHANIVKVFDAGGTDDGLVYIVMERLVGRTLRDVLGELNRLTPAEALLVAEQIARAVDAAHKAGIIHRDLKPENVFITAKNTVKVLDFGIAKVLEQGAPTTQKDLLHGTVLYMSPEQLQALRVTPRSDIFSLGTMLFEALHHHPALLGETPTLQELGWIQISRLPRPLSELDPTIPSFVARFVQRAILKNPDQRYASMAELAEAARAAAERLTQETLATAGVPPLVRELSIAAPAPRLAPAGARSAHGTDPADGRDFAQFSSKTERLVPVRGNTTPTPVTSGLAGARPLPRKASVLTFRAVSAAAAIVGIAGGSAHALIRWWLEPPAHTEPRVTATVSPPALSAAVVVSSVSPPVPPAPSTTSAAAVAATPVSATVTASATPSASVSPTTSMTVAARQGKPPVSARPPARKSADGELWVTPTPPPSGKKPRPGIDVPVPVSQLPGSGL